MTATAIDPEIRARLALVLDLDDDIAALRLGRDLAPWFGVAKVGLELFSASGPSIIEALIDEGFDVFCDLKLHDIPTTVGRAARVLGALGARYATMHAAGGTSMVAAGVEGLALGAASAGHPPPTALAVTVLTSDDEAPPHVLSKRVATALEAGAGGVVCAAADARTVRQLGPRLTVVVPGIRPVGTDHHDQARAASPEEAVRAGADVLVVGRAVTHAEDPQATAAAIAGDVASALGA